MDQINKKILYIFLHIRKTAGNTLIFHIKNNYRTSQYLFANGLSLGPDDSFKEYWRKILSGYTAEEKERLEIIGGHGIYYGIHELFPDKQPYYITVFREPEQLLLSHYNYLIGHLDSHNERYIKIADLLRINGKNIPLSEVLASCKYFDDLLFKSFYDFLFDTRTIEFPDCINGDSDINKLLEKFNGIMAKFHFIGTSSNIDNDLNYLYGLLNIRKFYRRQNVSHKYASIECLNEVERKLLADRTKLDGKLHALAVDLPNNIISNAGFLGISRLSRYRKNIFMLLHPLDYFATSGISLLYAASAEMRKRVMLYGTALDYLKKKLGIGASAKPTAEK